MTKTVAQINDQGPGEVRGKDLCSQGMFVAPSFVNVVGESSNSISDNRLNGFESPNPTTDGFTHVLSKDPIPNPSAEITMAPNLGGLTNAFILGPGRPPIPPKLVTQILAHKFIEMSELMPESLESPSGECPTFTIEGGAIVPVIKTTLNRGKNRKC